MSKTPTLEDVAGKAGVSTATVSRCLNAPNKVVPETRDRVLAAVRELGYSPNFGARALASKKTRTIAAVIPTMENAIFAAGLQAFQTELAAQGFNLLVATSGYDKAQEDAQIRSLAARGAEGMLLIGHDRSDETYRFLETQNIPAVAAWIYAEDAPIPSIGFDNAAAMAEVAHRVLELGHKNIAVLSSEAQVNDRAFHRLEGLKQAFKTAKQPAPKIIDCAFGLHAGGDAFRQLMAQTNPPSVVICLNDVLAVGACLAARDMGLVVPDDVSITGFADIDIAQVVTPALTTVHVPHAEMGRLSAKTLMAMIETGEKQPSICLPTYLNERRSLGHVTKV